MILWWLPYPSCGDRTLITRLARLRRGVVDFLLIGLLLLVTSRFQNFMDSRMLLRSKHAWHRWRWRSRARNRVDGRISVS